MFVGDDGRQFQALPSLDDETGSLYRVRLDDCPFLIGQTSRLDQDLERNAYLPNVMQQAGDPECADLARRGFQVLSQPHCKHGDVQ